MNAAVAVAVAVAIVVVVFFSLLKRTKQLWKANLCSDFQLSVLFIYYFISLCACMCVCSHDFFCYVVCFFSISFAINVEMSKFLFSVQDETCDFRAKSNSKQWKSRSHDSFLFVCDGDIVKYVFFFAWKCILNRQIGNQTFPTA